MSLTITKIVHDDMKSVLTGLKANGLESRQNSPTLHEV